MRHDKAAVSPCFRGLLPLGLVLCLFALLSLSVSCSVIDEDQSDCGTELKLDYDLCLESTLNIELQNELDRQTDPKLLKAIRDYMSPIFSDYAQDLDLSFYDVQGDSARLHHEQHIVNANEVSYTLYMPRRNYMHTAAANVNGNGIATLEGSDRCHTAQFLQPQSDTVCTQKTGLFSARQPVKLEDGKESTIYVRLYMANCAAGLILDTSEVRLKDLKVLATGFASGFSIADSSFVYAAGKTPVVVADKIDTGNSGLQCFCTVNFPSPRKTGKLSRHASCGDDSSLSGDDEALWRFIVRATLEDGTVTESVLGVSKPLDAGRLKIIHAKMGGNGGLEPEEQEVAVSITLDWKEAGHHDIPL